MIASSRNMVGKVYLLSILISAGLAAPVPTDGSVTGEDLPTDGSVLGEDLPTDGSVLGEDLPSRDVVELAKRAGNSINNPIEASFSTNGWVDAAEIDCWVMLCLQGGNRVYRRIGENTGEDTDNYRDSGGSLNPFYPNNESTYGTTSIAPEVSSAEDFPWRSIRLGTTPAAARGDPPNDTRGLDRYLVGVLKQQNNAQGGAISRGYRQSGVPYNNWFRITFTGTLGPVCRALHSNPPDTSICRGDFEETLFGRKGVKIADYVYQKDAQKTHGHYTFHNVRPAGS